MLNYDSSRLAPESILTDLRAIDSTAELLWWGPRPCTLELDDGLKIIEVVPVWLLGTVRHNAITRKVAGHFLSKRRPLGAQADIDNERYWRLVYQGFRAVTFFPARDVTSEVADNFRRRDWLMRHQFNQEEARRIEEMDTTIGLEKREKAMADAAKSEMPGIWRFVFKGRRSFNIPLRLSA